MFLNRTFSETSKKYSKSYTDIISTNNFISKKFRTPKLYLCDSMEELTAQLFPPRSFQSLVIDFLRQRKKLRYWWCRFRNGA